MKKQYVFFINIILKITVLVILPGNVLHVMAESTGNANRIGAALGYSFSGYREETYSDINRFLDTLSFHLDANIEKSAVLHSYNAGFYMGDSLSISDKPLLMEDYDAQTGESFYTVYPSRFLAIRGFFEYALDFRLWGNDTFPGYFGGAFRADAYLQFSHYPSITGLFSLNLHATQKWIIDNDNSLTFSMGAPVFGFAVRPPYAGADAALIQYAAEQPLKILSLGEICSLHNYWALFGDLKYQHTVNSLVSLYSGLGFELSRFNFPRPRLDAILRISSGITFTF